MPRRFTCRAQNPVKLLELFDPALHRILVDEVLLTDLRIDSDSVEVPLFYNTVARFGRSGGLQPRQRLLMLLRPTMYDALDRVLPRHRATCRKWCRPYLFKAYHTDGVGEWRLSPDDARNVPSERQG